MIFFICHSNSPFKSGSDGISRYVIYERPYVPDGIWRKSEPKSLILTVIWASFQKITNCLKFILIKSMKNSQMPKKKFTDFYFKFTLKMILNVG